MGTNLFALALLLALAACASPSMLVYSSGFSFANYDYIVIDKPDGAHTGTAVYGLDVQLANLLSRYNMKVVGSKELEHLSPEIQKRALFARMSLEASNKTILLSVSFDDAVTGRTGSSITTYAKGKIFKADDRSDAFEEASQTIVNALQRDKGLQISEDTAGVAQHSDGRASASGATVSSNLH